MACLDRLNAFDGLTVAASLFIERLERDCAARPGPADPERVNQVLEILDQLRLEFAARPFAARDLEAWLGAGSGANGNDPRRALGGRGLRVAAE
ncbi:MAG: hypothetical protein H6907_15380 [Hyphomicrobiales bacterium]|nr:hypothetical protein [Hyphomicrobiales bacterium]MCP5373107.1 hypothetical protein [Hyphomicrobiales bacterium]